jgi:methanogenic corrinoid protein MtbC1
VIPTSKTAGGHRRLLPADVIKFVRATRQPVLKPEILGLPEPSGPIPETTEQFCNMFQAAVLQGDESRCRQLIVSSYMNGKPLSKIFDEVIAQVFHRIGEAWECDKIDVYQERVATEISRKLIHELRSLQPMQSASQLLAVGGTPAGDNYSLANQMVEVLFLHLGWQTQSLGSNLPFESLAQAATDYKPNLFWISVSHIVQKEPFLESLNCFSDQLPRGTSLVLGGNALDLETQSRITAAVCCGNMQQLEVYANSIMNAAVTVDPKKGS